MQMNKSKIPLTYDAWDKLEHEAIKKILKGDILTQNKTVAKLEQKMAQHHNRKFCLMVNSGSSANLLGVSAMKYKKKLNIKNDDEFLAPGIGWSTSCSLFIQNNLKLRFIDVDLDTFNINPKEIRNNITNKTKRILAINI